MSQELELVKTNKLLSNLDCEVAHRTINSVVDPRLKAGKWLLHHETYTSWRSGQSSARLLWLNGIRELHGSLVLPVLMSLLPRLAGAGKTVLSYVP